jgi:hypothetical protein
MRNLIIDGAAGGETKRCHDVTFPLFTLYRGKDRVHFFTGLFQKENMHDGISFDRIQPKQVGYFGTRHELTENYVRK